MINHKLADEMGLTTGEREVIETLHKIISDYEKCSLLRGGSLEDAEGFLTACDYTLQELWGFPKDEKFHTYFDNFKFKKEWVGRTFVSGDGTTFTIPLDVRKREFYPIGEGFVDVGDGFYSRFSGVKEVGRKSFQEMFDTKQPVQ